MGIFTGGSQAGGTYFKDTDIAGIIRNFDEIYAITSGLRITESDYSVENIEIISEMLIKLTGGI